MIHVYQGNETVNSNDGNGFCFTKCLNINIFETKVNSTGGWISSTWCTKISKQFKSMFCQAFRTMIKQPKQEVEVISKISLQSVRRYNTVSYFVKRNISYFHCWWTFFQKKRGFPLVHKTKSKNRGFPLLHEKKRGFPRLEQNYERIGREMKRDEKERKCFEKMSRILLLGWVLGFM